MRWALILAVVVAASCGSPRPLPGPPPRFETLPDTSFAMNTVLELTITRTALANEAIPVEADVRVVVMTVDSVRVEPEQQVIKVGSMSSATVRFRVPRTASLELVVDWGAPVGATQLRGFVAEVLDSADDITVTFDDRMDQCSTVQRATDRTFCELGGQVHVYGPTGAFEQTISGRELRVSGAEVWISQLTGLSHWTDLPTGLRFDATAPLWLGAPWGETFPGRALRGTDQGVAVITWDGTALTHSLLDGFPPLDRPLPMFQSDAGLLLVDTFTRCLLERGCVSRVCDPIVTCESGLQFGSDERYFWQLEFRSEVRVASYHPRDHAEQLRGLELPGSFLGGHPLISTNTQAFNRPVWTLDQIVLLPTADDDGPWLQMWRPGGEMVTANTDWLIARMEARTLKFHRLP